MFAPTDRIHLADVHELLGLLEGLIDLRSDPHAWRLQLLRGFCGLLDASVGLATSIAFALPRQNAAVEVLAETGFGSDGRRRQYLRRCADASVLESPILKALAPRLAALKPNHTLTVARHELVSDRLWYKHPHVCEVRKPAGLDHCVYSLFRGPGPHTAMTLSFHRAWGDRRRFLRREVALLDLVHARLQRLYAAEKTATPRHGLSPRQHQTLTHLMAGKSQKEIADAMGRSQHTVHDHIKAIYRHFGVSSRSELLARFIA